MDKSIRGRIIRILDTTKVIIDLGHKDGIQNDSIFRILGEVEEVINPFTQERLGVITVVKAKLKAFQVYDKFTVATTRWTMVSSNLSNSLIGSLYDRQLVDEGELLVDPEEIQPWKAKSEIPVRVGDTVEVRIRGSEHEIEPDSKSGTLLAVA